MQNGPVPIIYPVTEVNNILNIRLNNRDKTLESRLLTENPTEESCRICQNFQPDERLTSPCHCIGSVGFVHRSCLETWLTTSGRTSCEICSYQYRPQVETKTFKDSINTFKDYLTETHSTAEGRFFRCCAVFFFIFTPLCALASWLSVIAGMTSLEHGQYWLYMLMMTVVVLIVTMYCTLLMITASTYITRFRAWKTNECKITMI